VLDDLAVRQREMREPSGVRRPVLLALMPHDHDAGPRRNRRDLGTQAKALLPQAARAPDQGGCGRQQRNPTFEKKNVASASVKFSAHEMPTLVLFEAPPRIGF